MILRTREGERTKGNITHHFAFLPLPRTGNRYPHSLCSKSTSRIRQGRGLNISTAAPTSTNSGPTGIDALRFAAVFMVARGAKRHPGQGRSPALQLQQNKHRDKRKQSALTL